MYKINREKFARVAAEICLSDLPQDVKDELMKILLGDSVEVIKDNNQ